MIGFVLAAIAAVADWRAVALDRERVEAWAKPAVMGALAIVVLSERPAMWGALLAAVLLSLLGDVLLLPRIDQFVGGLASFLAAHVAYAVALATRDPSPQWIAIVLVTLLAVGVGGTIARHAGRRSALLAVAVLAYIATITTMFVLALGVGVTEAIGAGLFVLSDAILGWNRFVSPIPHGRLLTHVNYHVGQAILILGFILA